MAVLLFAAHADGSTPIALDSAVRGAIRRGLIQPVTSIDDHSAAAFFVDLDAFQDNMKVLRDAFPPHWLHCMAIKTNPLAATLTLARAAGHGAECASIGEVMHAISLGFKPHQVVYDSPCKTLPEIRFALEHGVQLNIDNLQELERVRDVLQDLGGSASVIGLRINPLVGAGSVSALSVSTRQSKFGVMLEEADETARQELVALLVHSAPFVTALHCHVGSGSMSLEQMAQGAAVIARLALDVNEARRHATGSSARVIDVLDIGGGLPVSFGGGEQTPTFGDYAAALRGCAPSLFDASAFRQVVTEFGAAMHCRFGWLGSVVELTKRTELASGASAGGMAEGGPREVCAPEGSEGQIAVIHAGSDLFLRACYAPEMRAPHPVAAYTAQGERRCVSDSEPALRTDVAGPLCFAGDIVVRAVPLPRLVPGDVIVLQEAGGNTLSLSTSHCARRRPPVYGYRLGLERATQSEEQDGLRFDLLAAGATYDQALEYFASAGSTARVEQPVGGSLTEGDWRTGVRRDELQ